MSIVCYRGQKFLVDRGVYEPAEDTFLLADNLNVHPHEQVLELGTGCGLLAILAAEAGARVVATDVNQAAIECARANAVTHGVVNRIDFRLGDLFEPVAGERFDLVIFNPPYLPVCPGEALGTPLDKAWEAGADGRAVIDPFSNNLSNHLTKAGQGLFVQSSLSNLSKTLKVLREKGLRFSMTRKKLPFEELFLFRVFK